MVQELDNDVISDIDPDYNHFNVLYPNLDAVNQSKYYNIGEFNDEYCLTATVNDLSVIHLNARSLGADSKHDYINSILFMLKLKFHIICITESWLTDATKDLYTFEGYSAFHSIRPGGRRGGGVSVYVADEFSVRRVKMKCNQPNLFSFRCHVEKRSLIFSQSISLQV